MDYKNIKSNIEYLIANKTDEEVESYMKWASEFMLYHRCAMMAVETKFKVLNEQFSMRHERSPITSITTRLKSFESIRHKLKRRNLPVTLENMENMNDIAGVRVICAFLDDLYMLCEYFLEQDDVRLIERKDYIRNPKPNGYRSMHLIVEVPIFLCEEKHYVRVEVQLRTIAMESWANLEHRLRYKKELSEEVLKDVSEELYECAKLSSELDLKMQKIRYRIEM